VTKDYGCSSDIRQFNCPGAIWIIQGRYGCIPVDALAPIFRERHANADSINAHTKITRTGFPRRPWCASAAVSVTVSGPSGPLPGSVIAYHRARLHRRRR
jgi:hypothetical protein